MLTAAPARVVLAGGAGRDRGRHPPLEFVTVFFMVSSFYLGDYLSTGKRNDVSYSVLKETQVTI